MRKSSSHSWKSRMGSAFKPRLGSFTTPCLRVAQAAYRAKREYKHFTEQDVTPDLIAPELHVYGHAQAEGPGVANVLAIVITPRGQHTPGAAIRPTSSTDVPVEFRNMVGMESGGRSLMAVFPLDALQMTNEVHIVYDAGVHDGSAKKFCEDCAVGFDLKKIR